VLGRQERQLLQPHKAVPQVHRELEQALREPSLYDEVLRFLHRRRLRHPRRGAGPATSPALPGESDVEAAWSRITMTHAMMTW